jgi:HrpA-like RNA helicase
MSATLDDEMIKHFLSPITTDIPVFNIPGRTFPVEKEFKSEFDFIPSIINLAQEKMNILAFVE